MAIARKKPSLVQKDLLAQKLAKSDSEELCNTARPRLDRSELGPRLNKPIRLDSEPRLYRTDCKPRLWLYEIAELGLL